jgi:hypothetical protein
VSLGKGLWRFVTEWSPDRLLAKPLRLERSNPVVASLPAPSMAEAAADKQNPPTSPPAGLWLTFELGYAALRRSP